MLFKLLLVGCGGFAGSIGRFWIANEVHKHVIGTWIANVSGSLLLAIIMKLYINNVITEPIWLLGGVGFCGAFTTFSTFGKETLQFIFDKQYGHALLYVLSSFIPSLLLMALVLIW